MPEDKIIQAPANQSIGDFLTSVMGAPQNNPGDAPQENAQQQNGQQEQAEASQQEQETPEEFVEQEEGGEQQQSSEGDVEFDPVFEVEYSDKEKETFDVTKEEDRTKLLNYAKEYKTATSKLQEYAGKEDNLKLQENNMMNAIRLMYSQQLFGTLDEDNLTEKSYDEYLQETNGDKKAASQLARQDRQKIQRATEFAGNFQKSAEQFASIKNNFQKEHPEVKDVDKWIEGNMNDYIEGIVTFGEKPMKEDTLEMIYFWKNKEQIFKDFKDKVLQEVSKRKPETPAGKTAGTRTIRVKGKNIPQAAQKVEDAMDALMKKKMRGENVLIKDFL